MNIWSSRTKMEHAKTRAIKLKEANGEDKDKDELDEVESLEKTIDIQKETIEHQKDTIRIMGGTIEKQDEEIKRLRDIINTNSLFMQQIVMELINKPAPKSPAQLYAENKGLNTAVAAATNTNTAGPKGKLP